MIKRFAAYFKPHKALFFADMAAAIILSLCDLLYPSLTRDMLNRYIPDKNMKMLMVLAAVLLLVYLVKTAMNYFVTYYGHVVGVRIQADMRRDMLDHLERLPLSYFDSNKTGTIMSRLINDLMNISELAHHGPEDVFISLFMLIGAFVLMARIYLPLTLVLYAILPFMIFFAVKKQSKMNRAFTESKVEIGEVNASVENSVSGIRVSKAFTNSGYENRRFENGNKRFVKARSGAYKVMAEYHSGMTLISDVLLIVMYIAGGLFLYFDKIDLPDFTAFVLYITIFLTPIRKLVNFVEQYEDGMTGFKRFCEAMDYPAEDDDPDASDAGVLEGQIAFENVSFSYEGGKRVFDGLSISVEKGKTLALVGPSGGGKSTLCNLIPRFYELDSGRITIDSKDIRSFTRDSLRKNIGIVSQDVFLFNSTIYENIAYGDPDASEEKVINAAKLANIHDYICSLPDGYMTEVGERGIKLSGGQKQRIAIARVFLKNPPVLILDEATSALDNVTERLIQKSLDSLCSGRTSIIVAHRLTTVKGADEILVVTDEGIAERGSHDALMAKNGIYAELWGDKKEVS